MDLQFRAVLWQHPGGWWFVTLPADVSDEVRDAAGPPRGFGSVRVEVELRTSGGPVRWRTSVFPDKASGSYLLPVKAPVRAAADADDGAELDLGLRLV